MKKLITLFLIIAATLVGTTAQAYTSINWTYGGNTVYGAMPYTVNQTATDYTFESDYIYVHLSFSDSLQKVFYYVEQKLPPQFGTPNQNGEFGFIISEDAPVPAFDGVTEYYNYPPGFVNFPYPTSGTIYSGSCNLTTLSTPTIYFSVDALYTDGEPSPTGGESGFYLFPALN